MKKKNVRIESFDKLVVCYELDSYRIILLRHTQSFEGSKSVYVTK